MQKNRFFCRNADKIFFVLSVLFSVAATYIFTGTCIDSDAASELILAEHLAKTGQFFSTDWIYSTELRVLNTQLIFAPLFYVFTSWHAVRFVGALVLQGMFLLCYFAAIRMLQLPKKVFFLGGGILLLPVSVCYGRIVLYNSYYIPHLSLSLLVLGLTFWVAAARAKGWQKACKIAGLAALSFVGGLGGIRQLMMTHAPLCLAVFLLCFLQDFKNKKASALRCKPRLWLGAAAIIGAVFSYAGFYINKNILAEKYTFTDYSTNTLRLLESEKINDVAYGFLHPFGFRDGVELLSVTGLLSVLAIGLALAFLGILLYKLWRGAGEPQNGAQILHAFALCYVAVMVLTFCTLGQDYYYVLYFTPVTVLFVTVFVLSAVTQPQTLPKLHLRRWLSFGMVVLLAVNGVVNAAFLADNGRYTQKYEGLKYQNPQGAEQISPAAEFLATNGYILGYATFWNSNILTELTDGQVQTVTVEVSENGGISYYDWLTLRSNRTRENEKPFLLLDHGEAARFAKTVKAETCELIYKDDYFCIFAPVA